MDEIYATPTGRLLIDMLNISETKYKVITPPFKIPYKYSAYQEDYPEQYIRIDPNFHPDILTTCGLTRSTTTRILAHELGHLTGTEDDGPNDMNNVNEWENPIMLFIDGCERLSYKNEK